MLKTQSHDSAVVLVGIYPKEMEVYVHMKPSMQVFIAALFIIAKTKKQPRCSSVSD